MSRAPLDGPEQFFHFAAVKPPAARETARATPLMRRGAQPGERVLITGISGGQGRLIARRLLAGNFKITGVDKTAWEGHPEGVRIHVLDVRKRKFEDVFRTERPDAVVHLAYIRHFRAAPAVRHEVNVLGTKRVLEYAAAAGVKRVVVL